MWLACNEQHNLKIVLSVLNTKIINSLTIYHTNSSQQITFTKTTVDTFRDSLRLVSRLNIFVNRK